MEPITDDLSLRKQNMFFVEMKSKNCIYPLNSDWKDRSDWLADNNNQLRHEHLQVRPLDSDFWQGIDHNTMHERLNMYLCLCSALMAFDVEGKLSCQICSDLVLGGLVQIRRTVRCSRFYVRHGIFRTCFNPNSHVTLTLLIITKM